MIARYWLERWYVEAGKNVTQPLIGGRCRVVKIDRGRILIAGVEQHRSALLHIGIDLGDRLWRRHFCRSINRPIDQRIEGEFISRRIDADWFTRLESCAVGESFRQAKQTRLADIVHSTITSYNVGEMRGIDGLENRLVTGLAVVLLGRRGSRAKGKYGR